LIVYQIYPTFPCIQFKLITFTGKMPKKMNGRMNLINIKEKSETKFTSIFSNLNENLIGDVVDFELGSPKTVQVDRSLEQQFTVCRCGEVEKLEKLERGRKRKKRPPTPEHFWDVGFPSDDEIESRQLIFKRKCSLNKSRQLNCNQ
ncbi:hypothetical protein T08_12961, partial [Trichinella sp. T8]